jgi:hypothetical protein
MPDISDIDAAQSVKIVGSESDGTEQTPVSSSGLSELKTTDKINQQGEDIIINLSTTAVEAKVGSTAKTDRSYVFLQALDKNVKWGFDSNCRFDAFKNQLISIPASEDCTIFIKADSGSRNIVVGEG